MTMKKFNINDHMYIRITDDGWSHLKKTVGEEYINNCIKTPAYEKIINGSTWYRLQCWQVFDLLETKQGMKLLFDTEVMFDEDELISIN